jgi:acetoin utilization protein AcuB
VRNALAIEHPVAGPRPARCAFSRDRGAPLAQLDASAHVRPDDRPPMVRRLQFDRAMRIDDIMTKAVRVAAPELDAETAWKRMHDGRMHHLVIMEGDRVTGVLSERDLGGARGAALRKARTAGDLMTRDAVVVAPSTTLRQAANLLRGRGIGCLPVLDGKRLVGIVTTTDLLDLIGRGAERPVASSTSWTLRARGPRKRAVVRARAAADHAGRGRTARAHR